MLKWPLPESMDVKLRNSTFSNTPCRLTDASHCCLARPCTHDFELLKGRAELIAHFNCQYLGNLDVFIKIHEKTIDLACSIHALHYTSRK